MGSYFWALRRLFSFVYILHLYFSSCPIRSFAQPYKLTIIQSLVTSYYLTTSSRRGARGGIVIVSLDVLSNNSCTTSLNYYSFIYIYRTELSRISTRSRVDPSTPIAIARIYYSVLRYMRTNILYFDHGNDGGIKTMKMISQNCSIDSARVNKYAHNRYIRAFYWTRGTRTFREIGLRILKRVRSANYAKLLEIVALLHSTICWNRDVNHYCYWKWLTSGRRLCAGYAYLSNRDGIFVDWQTSINDWIVPARNANCPD